MDRRRLALACDGSSSLVVFLVCNNASNISDLSLWHFSNSSLADRTALSAKPFDWGHIGELVIC